MSSDQVLLLNDDVEGGGDASITKDFAYRNNVANADIEVRLGFLRKVYSLLGVQLLITFVFGVVCMLESNVQFFVRNNDWMLTVAFVVSIAILLALHVWKKHHPANLILLGAFTVVQSYTVAVIITYYDQMIVLQALLLTLVIVCSLTSFTMQSKRDFSVMGAGLFAGLCALMVGSVLQVFLGGSTMDFFISVGGALLFSLFIIYDTHMILHRVSPEEYIFATISLYLDIVNLFLYILRIIAESKK